MAIDLREFKCDVHTYKICDDTPSVPIYIAGNRHSIEEASEIHYHLGQLIETAKREFAEEKPKKKK